MVILHFPPMFWCEFMSYLKGNGNHVQNQAKCKNSFHAPILGKVVSPLKNYRRSWESQMGSTYIFLAPIAQLPHCFDKLIDFIPYRLWSMDGGSIFNQLCLCFKYLHAFVSSKLSCIINSRASVHITSTLTRWIGVVIHCTPIRVKINTKLTNLKKLIRIE